MVNLMDVVMQRNMMKKRRWTQGQKDFHSTAQKQGSVSFSKSSTLVFVVSVTYEDGTIQVYQVKDYKALGKGTDYEP